MNPFNTLITGASSGIGKKLDVDKAVLFPTAKARLFGTMFRLFPSFFEKTMATKVRAQFIKALPPDRI